MKFTTICRKCERVLEVSPTTGGRCPQCGAHKKGWVECLKLLAGTALAVLFVWLLAVLVLGIGQP